jgi:hypothetical protein
MRVRLADLSPDLRRQFKAAGAKSPSKYNAQKVCVDGITFASRKEARRYGELKLLRDAGQVRWFIMQVPFRLDGGIVYRADFLVVWSDGRVSIQDTKGARTATYKIKKREVEFKYGITIEEI